MIPNKALAQNKTRWEFTILGSMYVGYMAFILSRTTLAVASPEMINDPNLGLDEAGYGDIAAWGMAGMIAGKLLTGVIADWLGVRLIKSRRGATDGRVGNLRTAVHLERCRMGPDRKLVVG